MVLWGPLKWPSGVLKWACRLPRWPSIWRNTIRCARCITSLQFSSIDTVLTFRHYRTLLLQSVASWVCVHLDRVWWEGWPIKSHFQLDNTKYGSDFVILLTPQPAPQPIGSVASAAPVTAEPGWSSACAVRERKPFNKDLHYAGTNKTAFVLDFKMVLG